MSDPQEFVAVELDDNERKVLLAGLLGYREASRPTEAMTRAIGFEDRDDFENERERIARAVENSTALTRLDWTRALLTLEVMFASDLMGAGYEWSIVTGLADPETLSVLRRLQHKLVGVVVRL